MNIAILFGGKSQEHEVSCISAHSIFSNVDTNLYTPYLIGITKDGKFRYYADNPARLLEGDWEPYASDVPVDILGNNGPVAIYAENGRIEIGCVVPVLHGPFGEDGKIQGLLEYSGIPYVGNGTLSSAICMDKAISKDLLKLYNIPQTKYMALEKSAEIDWETLQKWHYPLFVKPANLGSSVGITKVKKREELEKAIANAFQFDKKILIEEGVNCREIECSALQMGEEIYISTAGELVVHDEFYDYEAKYKKNTTELVIPADLSEEAVQQIKKYAEQAFKILNCNALARIDFFIDKNTNQVMLNELNTMPGFTSISMYPKLLNFDGIGYSELITKLIRLAMEEYGQK